MIKKFMKLVYEEVELAVKEGNPPFAALITDDKDYIIAISHNQTNTKNMIVAHAEIEAISMANLTLNQKKLHGCKLYVNAEPCAMCSGAIIKSGIKIVFYGASHSSPDIYLEEINERTTDKLNITGGVMEENFAEQIKRGKLHQQNQNDSRC